MALALILRNSSKLQAGAFQQNLAKTATIFVNRDVTSNHRQHSTLTQHRNLNLVAVPPPCILKTPSVRLMSADHSKLWPIEKALSVGLIALIPVAIAVPNVVFDNLAAVASVIHFFWGLEAVVVDYARPIILGNVLPKLIMGLLYLVTITTLGGLIYFNVHDIGIGKAIRKFWAIKE